MPAIDAEEVRRRLAGVVVAMKANGAWDIARPADEAFVDMGAFGGRTMAFEQWLRWVFVPNVEALLAAGGPWPDASSVAVRAVREGDTSPPVAALVASLSSFDALFDGPPSAPPAAPAVPPGSAVKAYARSRALLDQGDFDGALAAATEALASDPAYPNAHNTAGWVLWKRPSPSSRDLEEAAGHFREALRLLPHDPIPVSNLGEVLLALGRDDDAVSTIEGLLGDEALAAHAHNWLGWYWTEKRPDLERAVVHLREAVKLRPAWGVAWINLAWALDRSGAEREALQAYMEAVASGDSNNPGFAWRRGLELAVAMQARDERPPPPVEGGAAAARTRRADEVGRAILRELARIPELATGRTLALGNARPVPEGEVPTAWIASIEGGRPRVRALVIDLRGWCTAEVLAPGEHGMVFRDVRMEGDDVTRAARAIADAILSDADLTAPNPLDVGIALLDLLTLTAPGRHGWRISGGAEYYAPDAPAAVGLEELGPSGSSRVFGISATARAEGGVRLKLLPEKMGDAGRELVVSSSAGFLEQQPEIVDTTRRALAARDAFLARPFGVGHAISIVQYALEASHVTEGHWQSTIQGDGYPQRWPEGWIKLRHARTERFVVRVDESADGCRVEVDGRDWTVRSRDDVRAALPAIVQRAAERLDRLTADALVEGACYRVLQAMEGLEPGEIVELVEDKYVPYDSVHMYTFASETRSGVRACLTEHTDAHCVILGTIDRYLTPA